MQIIIIPVNALWERQGVRIKRQEAEMYRNLAEQKHCGHVRGLKVKLVYVEWFVFCQRAQLLRPCAGR